MRNFTGIVDCLGVPEAGKLKAKKKCNFRRNIKRNRFKDYWEGHQNECRDDIQKYLIHWKGHPDLKELLVSQENVQTYLVQWKVRPYSEIVEDFPQASPSVAVDHFWPLTGARAFLEGENDGD